ncbi:MAG: radical SAM protein [Deltaproteobacteria bacterium]|nr:radical SAM protein [Deltaproteobacteria bacterium]
MNILVINVSLRPLSPLKLFPIGLGYVTTAMKNAGIDFDLLDIDAHRHSDEDVAAFIRRKPYDVVCLGCIVTGYRIVKTIAAEIKAAHPNAVVIAGNSVATSIVDTLLTRTQVDIAVMGEGDETIVELLRAVALSSPLDEVAGICFKRDGMIVRTPDRPLIRDISSLPYIDFSQYDVETYIATSQLAVRDPLPIPREKVRALPVNTARGCVAKCNFCYHVFKGAPYRYRSPDSIVGEIDTLITRYDLNYILFWDELTFFSKQQTLALVEKIIDEKVKFLWAANCRGNLFDKEEDIEIIMKMKQAGCISVGYSLESSDPVILRAMNKNVKVEEFSRQTALFHKAGIHAATSLVIGYPQETPDTIRSTFDCCIENKIYPSAGYLLPQPGSGMYDYAVEHGFVVDEEEYLLKMGDRQDLRLNLTQMSDEEMESEVLKGLSRCNDELNIGLKDNELIKTLFYRSSTTEEQEHE